MPPGRAASTYFEAQLDGGPWPRSAAATTARRTPRWTTYIAVESADAAAERVRGRRRDA